jgi:ribosomal protein L32E
MANQDSFKYKKTGKLNTGKKPKGYHNKFRESFFQEIKQQESKKPRKLIPIEEWKKRNENNDNQ